MANQFNTTVTIIAQEGQSVTINGPSGQQVTVTGGGQVSITFTSDVVNVIPMDEEVVEEEIEPLPLPEVLEEVVEFRQWPVAQPGSFFYRIDTLANAGKGLSSQIGNAELEDLASLMMMNKKTFNKIFARMNLSKNAAKNVKNRIRRFLNPELVRESNRRSLERYHNQRRQQQMAALVV